MPWNFNAPTRNIELGMYLASFLKALDFSDWETVFPISYPDIFLPGVNRSNRDHTEESPRVVKASFGGGDLFLIQGVKRTSTAARLVAAWSTPFNLQQDSGVNAQVRRGAEELFNALTPNSASTAQDILIAGHSYGGAVAQLWGWWLKSFNPSKRVRVATFGSPRCGPLPFRSMTATLDHARYWIYTDPVPFCPPHRSEAYNGHVLIGRTIGDRWSSTVQTGTGIRLPADGNATLDDYPREGVEYTDLNLVGWATGLLSPPVEAHSIHEYYLRVSRAFDRGVSFGSAPSGGHSRPTASPPPSPPSPPTPPPAVVAAATAVETAITTLRTTPNPHVFQALNFFGEWGVYRGAECVTLAGNRTRARRLANQGNQMLRQATARGVNIDAEIARVLAGSL